MTASLFNSQNGSFGNLVDGFVYPQFIGYAQRAPTTQDIYNPGTRWQDNSVNPAVQYYTTGAGLWYELPNSSFGVSSVTGTANQITAAPTTGAVVLSIPATFIAPGSIAATSTVTAGTGITSTTGNIVATAGAVSAGTTVTGGTGVTATTGNVTASAGNLVAAGTGNGVVVPVSTASGATPQTANARAFAVTFSSVSIAAGATQSFVIANNLVNSQALISMAGATTGAALNIQSITYSANTSITIVVENGTGATTSTANITFTGILLN